MGTEECAPVFFSAASVNVGIAGDLRTVLAVLGSVFRCAADYIGEFVTGTLDRAQAKFEMDQCGIFPVECAGEHHVHGWRGGIDRVSMVSRPCGIEGAVLDVSKSYTEDTERGTQSAQRTRP